MLQREQPDDHVIATGRTHSVRELLGETQEEVAEAAQMTQSEISRMERRSDHRLSTLRRLVKALGGDLEVVANFGDKRVRLHATD
jgi:transcriptional regulator with XRE-family HTH domain